MVILGFYCAVGAFAIQFRASFSQATLSFRPVLLNGSSTCASDVPFFTVSVADLVGFPDDVPDVVRCSYTCTAMTSTNNGSCSGFNLIDQQGFSGSAICQFFNCTSLSCNIGSNGCTYYQVGYSSANDTTCTFLPGAVDVSQNCSFPFTYNGGLYYQCVTAKNNDCNQRSRCLLASSNTLTFCSKQISSFVARNVTRNVTIPSVVSPVPLMTVNNWIIVLSRVDSTFPTGLGVGSVNYTNGFGNNLTNYWLGLENIYKLTNSAMNGGKTYRLRFEVQLVYLSNTGDAADAINDAGSPTNNQPWTLSTTGSCAVATSGPWWYRSGTNCGYSRLLGTSGGKGFAWGASSSWYMSKTARMMIKQVD